MILTRGYYGLLTRKLEIKQYEVERGKSSYYEVTSGVTFDKSMEDKVFLRETTLCAFTTTNINPCAKVRNLLSNYLMNIWTNIGKNEELKLLNPKLPDESLSQEDMFTYGYTWNGMLPISKEKVRDVKEEYNITIYALHTDGTESEISDYADIWNHMDRDGIFGVEVEDWKSKTGIDLGIEITQEEKDY